MSRIETGQLRRWRSGYGWFADKVFVAVSCRIWNGRRIWTILQDGHTEYEDHFEILRGSEVINETG